jgi:2-oxoglutarate ferredoxin oxidoreductase subunit gamma
MSPEAVAVFGDAVKAEGFMLLDSTAVPEKPETSCTVFAVPATEIADKEIGQMQAANMVMLGALLALTRLIPLGSVEKALKDKVPTKTIDSNLRAFQLGVAAGHKLTPMAS